MAPDTESSGCPPEGCSVLIVEDDPDIRQAIASLLQDDGYTVAAKADGAEGLEWLRTTVPRGACLVLLDLRMPVMDGGAFLTELRATPELKDLRVCVLSADPAPAPPGADYVLRKPVAASALLRVVERLCRAHGAVA
jgi:CheY-like chemotaxis protein